MKLIDAKVKFAAGKVFPGQWGADRQSIKLEFGNGAERDVWFNAGDPRYMRIRQGEIVKVLVNGEKFTIVDDDEDDDTPPTPQATPAALSNTPELNSKAQLEGLITMDETAKAQLYQELCKRAQVLKSCHVQIVSLFTDQTGKVIISDEVIQKYSVTLFLDLNQYWRK